MGNNLEEPLLLLGLQNLNFQVQLKQKNLKDNPGVLEFQNPKACARRLRNHIVQPFISYSGAHGLEDPTNCSIFSSSLCLSPPPPPHPANSATHLRGREASRRMQLGGTPPLPLEAVTSVPPRRWLKRCYCSILASRFWYSPTGLVMSHYSTSSGRNWLGSWYGQILPWPWDPVNSGVNCRLSWLLLSPAGGWTSRRDPLVVLAPQNGQFIEHNSLGEVPAMTMVRAKWGSGAGGGGGEQQVPGWRGCSVKAFPFFPLTVGGPWAVP